MLTLISDSNNDNDISNSSKMKEKECIAEILSKHLEKKLGLKTKNHRVVVKDVVVSWSKQKEEVDVTTRVGDLMCNHGQLMPFIFNYLNTREMYNMAFTSKAIMSQLTYEHIIQSVMMVNVQPSRELSRLPENRKRKSIKNLIKLIDDKAIFVPSPVRMLRLVNAKRCEICFRNIGYNSNFPLGVNMCYGWLHGSNEFCMTKLMQNETKNAQRGGVRRRRGGGTRWRIVGDGEILSVVDSRIARFNVTDIGFQERLFLWKKAFRDSTGNLCGPILTNEDDLDSKESIDKIHKERSATDPNKHKAEEIISIFKKYDERLKQRSLPSSY